MAQYSNTYKNTFDGITTTAVLNSETNTTTVTVTLPNGAQASATQPADANANANNGIVASLRTAQAIAEQFNAQGQVNPVTGKVGGFTTTSFGRDTARVVGNVERQQQQATVEAAATDTPVPDSPNPPPPAAAAPVAQAVAVNTSPLTLTQEQAAATSPLGPPTTEPAQVTQRTINPAAGEGPQTVSVGSPAPVPPSQTGYTGAAYDDDGNLLPGFTLDENRNPVFVGGNFVEPATAASAADTRAKIANAQQQNTLNDRVAVPKDADWRVRLSLANDASYLYRGPNPGILAPLTRTNGVVFPYTPAIETNYQAKYDSVDLTHSNYRGYFYRNSSVDQISIRGKFTAQDTREAEYLLAVITFFKAVTKMFYGASDPLAGTPPPLVFLSGLGQYQFNNNPCVISSFQYSLPDNVDYIRANGFNNYGINLDNRRQQSSGPPATGILGAIATVQRLRANFLAPGAIKSNVVAPNPVSANNSKTNYTNSTYVPTMMDINLTLLPIQTRSQMSSQFNLQKFASGGLLQQGFW